MTTQTEALKLALEALETCYSSETSMYRNFDKAKTDNAITAIKEALAHPAVASEQEPVAIYGYCPKCGAEGVARERRPNGNDCCANGHTYPSRTANKTPQRKPLTDEQMQFLATAIGQAQQIIDTHNAEFVTARDDLRRCAELLAAHGIKENT